MALPWIHQDQYENPALPQFGVADTRIDRDSHWKAASILSCGLAARSSTDASCRTSDPAADELIGPHPLDRFSINDATEIT